MNLGSGYTLEGVFGMLDLARFDGPMNTDMEGSFQVQGRGIDEVAAHVDVGPGQLGLLPLHYATVEAALTGTRLTLEAMVAADTGALEVNGEADFARSLAALEAALRMESLDVTRALGIAMSSTLTGDMQLHTSGGWPPDSGRVSVRLSGSRYDVYHAEEASAEAVFRARR